MAPLKLILVMHPRLMLGLLLFARIVVRRWSSSRRFCAHRLFVHHLSPRSTMSAKTWIWSNSELTAHSSQLVWASAAFCRETWADHTTGVAQLWRIDCAASQLDFLATTMMAMSTTSNDAVAIQIPIAA